MACTTPDAESYYHHGKEMRESGDPVTVMKAFIAATRVRSKEYGYQGRSFSNMATMCRMGERHDIAYALYEQSAFCFALAGDTTAYAFALNNMAWELAVQGDKPSALVLVDSAVRICPSEPVIAKTLESRVAACLYAEEYDSVLILTAGKSDELYFDIVRSQAFTFLRHNDSALYYARRILERTDNPRYLDDVYYILTYCDSTAEVDEVRRIAAQRTDIRRELERNDPAWMEAMLMAERSLSAPQPLSRKTIWMLVFLCLLTAGGVVLFFLLYRRRRIHSLDYQCSALRKSKRLRDELCWNDYPQFTAVCDQRLSGIVSKLKKRGLSEREIRICVLVLIGFSYAEMAQILFRAESGIGKDKYLIAKHLGVSVKELRDTIRTIACEK